MKIFTVTITESVRKAIKEMYLQSGRTQTQIADMVGVKNPSVNSWLNGNNKSIKNENWVRLLPMLKPYMDPAEYKEYKEKDYWIRKEEKSPEITILNPNDPAKLPSKTEEWRFVDEKDLLEAELLREFNKLNKIQKHKVLIFIEELLGSTNNN